MSMGLMTSQWTLSSLPSDVSCHIISFLTFHERFPLRCAATTSSHEPGTVEKWDRLLFHDLLELDLSNTAVTSAGLSFLRGAPRLKKLSLSKCRALRN